MWLYAAFVGAVPVGSPPERFHHSPSEYNGRLLRATNHEPRVTIHPGIMAGFYEPRTTSHEPLFFSRAEGYSRRCRYSEFVAAKRHLSPRRPANCGLRSAGPSPNSMNELRPTTNESTPGRQAPYLTKKSQKIFVLLHTYFYYYLYL